MSLYTSVLHEYKVLFHNLLQRNLLDMNHVFAFCPSLSTIFLRDCSIMDSSDSLLSIISIKRPWKDSRIFDRRVIVTCSTGCVEPEERILVAAISSKSRTSCLVSSASELNMPPISASRSCSTERRSAGGVLDRLLI